MAAKKEIAANQHQIWGGGSIFQNSSLHKGASVPPISFTSFMAKKK